MSSRPSIALIGDPVRQSVSPPMQQAAFDAAGLRLTYTCVRLSPAELVSAFPELRRRFAGLNVTRPLKEAVVPLLEEVSPAAARAGSVNTVAFPNGVALGYSTDGAGFLAALARVAPEPVRRALILGTGGAARAVAAALCDQGASVAVAGRNPVAAQRLQADLAVERAPAGLSELAAAIEGADLLVNATPVGGEPGRPASPLPDTVPLPAGLVVFDLVYRPWRTPLLERAAREGCRTVEGIEMLVEQGARSFELWTGCPAPLATMRAAAYAGVSVGAP